MQNIERHSLDTGHDRDMTAATRWTRQEWEGALEAWFQYAGFLPSPQVGVRRHQLGRAVGNGHWWLALWTNPANLARELRLGNTYFQHQCAPRACAGQALVGDLDPGRMAGLQEDEV